MTDLEQARSAEAGRVNKILKELDSQQQLRLSRIDVEMSRRGLQNSDARRQAIFEARLETLNQAILQRIAIRKDMVRNFPELGSLPELNHLRDVMHADVVSLQNECQKNSILVPPEVFAELRARVRDCINILRRETELQVRIQPKLPELSLNIPRGGAARADVSPSIRGAEHRSLTNGNGHSGPAVSNPASDPFDGVCRKVDEVIADLRERNAPLADALRRLAQAIKETGRLDGDARIVFLEQLQFLAEQAARVAVLRRISVVKGILVALGTGLNDIPSVSPRLRSAISLLEVHFGIGTNVNEANARAQS